MVARAQFKQLKRELEMHKAADADIISFERQVYADWKACEDVRSKVRYAALIAEVMRLGKRETAAQSTQNNVQINVLMDPERAKAVLRNLYGGDLPAHLADDTETPNPPNPNESDVR